MESLNALSTDAMNTDAMNTDALNTVARNTLAQATGDIGLSTQGAVIMTISIAIVTALAAFCVIKILREDSPKDHHHAPLDIDTRDRDN
jgi:type IV secretory pathway VirB6-like protein